jgi:hypothetical protein
MDKATRAAIARAYDANRGDGGGKNGAREGGKGGSEGFGGGRWLSGLSAAVSEVGDEGWDAAPHGPRYMSPTDPATRRPETLVRRLQNYFRPLSQG